MGRRPSQSLESTGDRNNRSSGQTVTLVVLNVDILSVQVVGPKKCGDS
jgi:hypothetical protein